jgi:hypothetical protein
MRQSESMQDEQRRLNGLIESLNSKMLENCHISHEFPQNNQQLENILPRPPLPPPTPPSHPDSRSLGLIIPERNSFSENETDSSATPGATSNTYYNSVFKLDISQFRKDGCRPFCNCPCHRRYRRSKNTPFGSLAVGFSSLPFLAPTCTEGCLNPSSFSATVTYYFPHWLFLLVISLIFVTSIFGDPFVGIKIRPMTKVFSIFRISSLGDMDGMKRLLGKKEVHPSASFWGGWTALHVSLFHLSGRSVD